MEMRYTIQHQEATRGSNEIKITGNIWEKYGKKRLYVERHTTTVTRCGHLEINPKNDKIITVQHGNHAAARHAMKVAEEWWRGGME